MGFLDKHFREVWISLIAGASSLFYLGFIFLQSPPSFSAADAVRAIPWVVYTCLAIALASALVPPILYVRHRLLQRPRRLPKALIETFE